MPLRLTPTRTTPQLTAAYPASLSRILILDLLMFLLQLTSLVVSYTTNHGSHIPKSPLFAYDDVLLPPSPAEVFHAKSAGGDEADLESGGLRRRRSRAGGYGVAEEIWLDDDDDDEELGNADDAEGTSRTWIGPPAEMSGVPCSRLITASSSTRLLDRAPKSPRRQEPPLIFSLSLSHLVNLVFRLPAPNPPRAFSGGTPDVSPLPTPGRRTVPLPLPVPSSGASLQASTAGAASAPSSGTTGSMGATSAPLASATTPTPTTGSTDRALDTDAEPEWEDETSEDDEEAARSSRRHGRRAMGVMPDIGRIPGSYWTDRVNRGGENG